LELAVTNWIATEWAKIVGNLYRQIGDLEDEVERGRLPLYGSWLGPKIHLPRSLFEVERAEEIRPATTVPGDCAVFVGYCRKAFSSEAVAPWFSWLRIDDVPITMRPATSGFHGFHRRPRPAHDGSAQHL
jgi:hypothetical protein